MFFFLNFKCRKLVSADSFDPHLPARMDSMTLMPNNNISAINDASRINATPSNHQSNHSANYSKERNAQKLPSKNSSENGDDGHVNNVHYNATNTQKPFTKSSTENGTNEHVTNVKSPPRQTQRNNDPSQNFRKVSSLPIAKDITLPSTASSKQNSKPVSPPKIDISIPSLASLQQQANTLPAAVLSKTPQALEIVPFPLDGTKITLTAILDHRTYYIRSLSDNSNFEYLKDANDFAADAMTAKPLAKLPERGDLFLAEFEGEYYRAMALKVTNNTIKVAFIDFGNSAEKALSDCKELSPKLQQRKRFTHKVVLANVPKVMLNEKCMEYLHELVNEMKSLQITYTMENNQMANLKLVDLDRNISLDAYMAKLNDVQKPTVKHESVSIQVKERKLFAVYIYTNRLVTDFLYCVGLESVSDKGKRYSSGHTGYKQFEEGLHFVLFIGVFRYDS